jgi:parvulin-like peptidyl-prolyl isomerase
MRAFVLALLLTSCGPGIQGGPTLSNKVNQDDVPAIQSNDILGRDAVTQKAKVKHVLIAWRDLGPAFKDQLPERAAVRTREQADDLAQRILARVRAGEAIEPIMKELSDDQGSAESGDAYDITVDAAYVFEFKRLSLRLNVDEAGLVMTQFGWHIIKRIE